MLLSRNNFSRVPTPFPRMSQRTRAGRVKTRLMRTSLIGIGCAALVAAALAVPPPSSDLPDVIVTHLSSSAKTVTVHLQNQGPGRGKGKVHLTLTRQGKREPAVRVDVPAPVRVFGVTQSRAIPLQSLGVEPDWNSQIIKVEIDSIGQARTSNKDFYEQLERQSGVIHNDSLPYVEAHPDLPDLVIERIYYERPYYLKIVYANRGRGRTGADFDISLRTPDRIFPDNYYYRFRVPPAGERRTTGGCSIGILGLKPGMVAHLTATIDPQGRVRETRADNNTWTGTVDLR